MTSPLPQTLVLIGAGKMGGAMLEGWLRIGMNPAGISLIDPKPSEEMVALATEKGMALNPDPASLTSIEVLVLATKPQMLDTAAPAVQAFIRPQTLLISILAGKTLSDLSARLPNATAMIRACRPRSSVERPAPRQGRESPARSAPWRMPCCAASGRSNGWTTRG